MWDPKESGKGSGRKGFKRSRRSILSGNIIKVQKPSIHQLARRAGIERISTLVYRKIHHALYNFVNTVLQDAFIHTKRAQRNTVTIRDINYALTLRGCTHYGFEF